MDTGGSILVIFVTLTRSLNFGEDSTDYILRRKRDLYS